MRPDRTLSRLHLALGFVVLAALCLPMADLTLAGHDPWDTLGRMALGFLRPDFTGIEAIGRALALTVAFAVAGVALGGLAGLVMAPFYHRRAVRTLAIALRSVHELFWALLLMQVLGISPAAGVLAIALPYAGIFAKVFAEAGGTVAGSLRVPLRDPDFAAFLQRVADAKPQALFVFLPSGIGAPTEE